MNRHFPFIFPSSENLLREGLRLFLVNYVWLLLMVILLCIVTYADKVGAQALKGIYQMLLAVLLCAFSILYCLYWYSFGFRLGKLFASTGPSFGHGVLLCGGGIVLNALLVMVSEHLGFSRTEIASYNHNVFLVELMLIISVFLLPVVCGLGFLSAKDKDKERNDGTYKGPNVSHEY